ncbi:MAG TPA: bifunctional sulfate adenylyltransferase/adenylylsulfate kinase [Gammaproteobacteria bacterium]|nr:bifunctional sulfate adenylyltransferase/adenylylsulfate kinase [Gammaproteobacteria bacterium]
MNRTSEQKAAPERVRELYVPRENCEARKAESAALREWTLTHRQICDLELLMSGGFAPLDGFLGRGDYDGVVAEMRLASGALWPMPITLDVTREFADSLAPGEQIALRDPEGVALAILTAGDVWEPNKEQEAEGVFGAADPAHPAVRYLLDEAGPVYVGGKIEGLSTPSHYDFKHLRLTPNELRERFARLGWRRIVAFQTRNPMHRAHMELTFRAAREAEANLLIQPSVGMTKPGDIDHFTRVRCYEHLVQHYPEQTTMLSLLPLAMRMGGPREALWHALIRRNHGATHFIVGRDHAGPGKRSDGTPFYGPYDAQKLVGEHAAETGITMLPFRQMVYVRERAQYAPEDEIAEGETVLNISGTEFRRRLAEGLDIPEWFSFPEVVKELRRTHPPLDRRGFTVFFTGLSGSGKSTIANALMVKLLELGGRRVSMLDGDLVRRNLSSELGFSKEHRDLNIRRIGYVASEITNHGGIAICAPIAPYAATRRAVREMVEATGGGFIEAFVSTPIETCEERDRKGLYARARAGKIKEFTGISDPYEAPEKPEITIDTRGNTPDEAAQDIMLKLERLGYIR